MMKNEINKYYQLILFIILNTKMYLDHFDLILLTLIDNEDRESSNTNLLKLLP